MANIPALVTVNGVELPEPSSYEGTTSTIVDSGRNVQGKVVGAVVRNDVAKVTMSWNYLTAKQWATILSLFTANFYCSVRFYNQVTAGYTTRQMYVSDRTAGMWRRSPNNGSIMGWTGAKLSLVEV
jgi:hypothetical protein|nr:MAG TPA: hypothetical protein [Caudoviricetes sp.]DAT48083.1 MAG TPA: hypothetical protein [Caudoviricetes sp.]